MLNSAGFFEHMAMGSQSLAKSLSLLSRRRFIKLAVLLIASTGLTAQCRQVFSSSRANESKLASGLHWRRFAGTQISLLLNDHPWTQGVQPHLAEFEALTGIDLQIQVIPEPDYFAVLESAMRAPAAQADVVFLPMDSTAYRLWQESLLLPLTPLINDPQLTAPEYNLFDFPEGFRLAAMYPPGDEHQQLFGIPATFETYILFYNKSLVYQYLDGVVPETMAELVQAAAKITQMGQGDIFGAVMRGIQSETIIDTVTGIVLNGWGDEPTSLPYGIWFDGDWLKPRLEDPRIVEGLDTYAQLMKAGPAHSKTLDWSEATQLFQAGKAAFYIDASLFGPSFEVANHSKIAGDVGYTVLPQSHGDSLTGHWLWGLGIPQQSAQAQAAWMFIQWATSQAMEAKIGVATGGAPRFSSWLTPSIFTEAMNIDYALTVQTAMQTSRPTAVFHPAWNQVALAIATTIQDIYDGVAATTAVSQLQFQVERIMAQSQESD